VLINTAKTAGKKKKNMRFISGFLGFSLLSIVFGALTLLVAEIVSGGNTLAVGFFILFGWPLSIILGSAIGIPLGLRAFVRLQQLEVADAEDLNKPLPHPSRRVRWLATATLGSGLCTITFLALMLWWSEPPYDRALVSNFQQHRASMNELVLMVEEDKKRGLVGLHGSWSNPQELGKIGISTDRYAKYKQLLRQANVPNGFSRHEIEAMAECIEFTYWVHGSAISSTSEKGYACIKRLENQTDAQFAQTLKKYDYHPVEGNWYIFSRHYPQ
jgi:hypothetical protein